MDYIIDHINYFGVTHHNTPLSEREVFSLTEDEIKLAYSMALTSGINEVFILSTCARTEFYSYGSSDQLTDFIKKLYHSLHRKCDFSYMMHKNGIDCVKHLMEVSCSVTSLLIGETQITSQIKKSYKLAKDSKSLRSILSRLIQSSLEAGKKIRNKTKLSDGSSSISYAAVEKICEISDDLSNKKILIIGAGMTGKLVAYNFQKKGATKIYISNRDTKKGLELSQKVNGYFIPFHNINESVPKFSIIVTCTNASYSILKYDDFKNSTFSKPILFMDLSVPRNIDKSISNLSNSNLLTIEDIDDVINKFKQKRKSELPKAKKLINELVDDFIHWFDDLNVTPTIAKLKNHYDRIQIKELEKISNKYDEKTLKAIDVFSNSLVKKIMKDSIEYLKSEKINEKSKVQFVEILSSIYKFKK